MFWNLCSGFRIGSPKQSQKILKEKKVVVDKKKQGKHGNQRNDGLPEKELKPEYDPMMDIRGPTTQKTLRNPVPSL